MIVDLYDKSQKTLYIHRLVAENFLKQGSYTEVNHINGIKTDNRVENLEWSTVSENLLHSHKINLHNVTGEKNPAATITEKEVIEIRSNYTYGKKSKVAGQMTKKELAEKYGVTFGCIKNIVLGKTWKHLL